MKNVMLLFTLFLCSFSFAQNSEFSTYDLKKVYSIIQFKPIKGLSGLNQQELNQYFNMVEADTPMLKQLNISSWYYCDYKKIDNYDTYNYYYKDISRDTYNKYCKEINALMLLDGVIIQPK
ncbi:hypothetical protein ACFO3U_09560 [Flavobacterium ponti]|uniref:Uncharacterized protein n=1 Tax=Flavobacterium ponti TaxID=665133 RepID=A0ABV9P3V3_9FLAO